MSSLVVDSTVATPSTKRDSSGDRNFSCDMFSRRTVMQRAVTLWRPSVGHKATWGHWDAQDSKGSYNPRPRTPLDALIKGEARLRIPNSHSPP